MGCITLGKSLKVIDSAGGYPNGKTQLLPLNPLKMFIYWLWSKQSGKYWPLKLKKKQLQMFYHNKWNLFRQTFRQGGTMFDCFSWARKNATRESIMGSKYFWNFIILLYFFGSVRVLYICITFVPKNARLQCNLADWNAIWRYFASMQLLFISSM